MKRLLGAGDVGSGDCVDGSVNPRRVDQQRVDTVNFPAGYFTSSSADLNSF